MKKLIQNWLLSIGLPCLAIIVLAACACEHSSSNVSVNGYYNYQFHVTDDRVVYDENSHAAFTGLVEYNDEVYLAFREGDTHRPTSSANLGKIVILKRISDSNWAKIASISEQDKDLRDPFFAEINEQLRLYCGYNYFRHNGEYVHGGSVFFECETTDGFSVSDVREVKHDYPYYLWLWKIRSNGNILYSVGYNEENTPMLLSSEDGCKWQSLAPINVSCVPTEADLSFDHDTLYCIIRRDTPVGSNSYWGISLPPYKDIKWKEMEVSVASPELYRPNDATNFLLVGREYLFGRKHKQDSISVSLFDVSRDGGVKRIHTFDTERLGDKGYPSFVNYNDSILCSFYTGDPSKTNIHIATISIERK